MVILMDIPFLLKLTAQVPDISIGLGQFALELEILNLIRNVKLN